MVLSLLNLIVGLTIQPHSMVSIHSTDDMGQKSGGSAVVIAKNRVLTAAHVVVGSETITGTCNGKEIPLKGIAVAPAVDLAVLEFTSDCPIEPIQMASENPALANDVVLVGCPSGKCFMVTKGIVSGYFPNRKGIPMMFSDAKVWYGNSGGPAIDKNGKLVGILSAMLSWSTAEMEDKELDTNSQNYAVIVPISVVRIFLEEVSKFYK